MLKYVGNCQHTKGQRKVGAFSAVTELPIFFQKDAAPAATSKHTHTKKIQDRHLFNFTPSHSDGPGPVNPWEMLGVSTSDQPEPDQR